MANQKRNTHAPEFKAKVALEAVRGTQTVNEIAQHYGVHPVQVSQWKKALLNESSSVFETDEKLYGEIGRLKMELDWLKKSPGSTCRDTT